MDLTTHLEHLAAEGARLAAAASACSGDEPIAACPGWDVDQLLRHIATVHEWARLATVGNGARPTARRPMEQNAPVNHGRLVDWYRDLHGGLVEALRTTDPDARCWQMWSGPDGPAYWARRQAHETVVHRLDMESVTDGRNPVDAELAVDGVDELMVMVPEKLLPTEPATTYSLETTDTGAAWRVAAGPRTTVVRREREAADVRVSGTAADLHAFCWNRRPETSPVVSDPAGWDVWRRQVQI